MVTRLKVSQGQLKASSNIFKGEKLNLGLLYIDFISCDLIIGFTLIVFMLIQKQSLNSVRQSKKRSCDFSKVLAGMVYSCHLVEKTFSTSDRGARIQEKRIKGLCMPGIILNTFTYLEFI
jgi:hypothetical protein